MFSGSDNLLMTAAFLLFLAVSTLSWILIPA